MPSCPYCEENCTPTMTEMGHLVPVEWSCGCGQELAVAHPGDILVGELQGDIECFVRVRPFPRIKGAESSRRIQDADTEASRERVARSEVERVLGAIVYIRSGHLIEEKSAFDTPEAISWTDLASAMFESN